MDVETAGIVADALETFDNNMKPNQPVTSHNLENILTDRALFGIAEQELRSTKSLSTKSKLERARTTDRNDGGKRTYIPPHERGYLDVLASVTGEEPGRSIIPPGEDCCRCHENKEMLATKLAYQQDRNTEIVALASDTNSLYTEAPCSLYALWPRDPTESPSQRQITIACWAAYVSMLAGEGYVDALGRFLEPQVKGVLSTRGIEDFDNLEAQAKRPENNKKIEEFDADGNKLPRRRLSHDNTLNQLSYSTNATLLKMLIRIRDLVASVDLKDPTTHIHGLPIPSSIPTSVKKFDKLEKLHANNERKYALKMPTNFTKHPPKLYEQLVLDIDGTGRNLRVVTVTGFRKNDKGFIVDQGLKVAWSGKPKTNGEKDKSTHTHVSPDAIIRRDTDELRQRRRECAVSMLEVLDWGQFQTGMLDQLVTTVVSYKAQMNNILEARKSKRPTEKEVKRNNKHKRSKTRRM